MTHYFQVILKNVAQQLEDSVSSLCFDHGAQGVSEELEFEQMSATYEPTILERQHIVLQVYFLKPPGDQFSIDLAKISDEIDLTVSKEQNKDWMEEWKKGFSAFPIAGDYWVIPSWLDAPAEAKKQILIDPGMAFGTGTHETTKLASKMLLDCLNTNSFDSVLDVGTGTGILAILTQKEQPQARILTTEIEPMAREVARLNFIKNEVENIELPDIQIEEIEQKFDMLIANIIDGVLINIKEELIRCLLPGGTLLLTGILEERDENFQSVFFEDSRIKIFERRTEGEWVGYIAQRISDA
ncbi:MAG: 50S ribosomal protein L11 methyltransferase [Bdellovibrionales bacterium]